MRILALRGENLASLPRVEVRLDEGPLADTRLFAIVGPTGAGKSTLLDLLCLALYDRVPRLVDAREAASDEHEIPAQDPRNVVRRGAAQASAEVDFVARSGAPLRARWEVWRARKKASGKLQGQRMRLFELGEADPREISGATKTETLRLIQAQVGLSFDEFRRAVLLAQGDFAAFLAARPDERAALLERMTGTELYAALSARAHARAREEDEALRALEGEERHLSILDASARAELDARIEGLGARRTALETRRDALARQAAWFEAEAGLHREVADAETARAEAEAAWAEAEPDRGALETARAAEALRPAFTAATEAEARRARARARADATAEQARAAEQAAAEADAEVTAAKADRRARTEAHAARRPEIEEAGRLDGALAEAATALAEAERAAAERARAAGAAATARAEAENRRDALDAEHRAAVAWLEAQAATRVVAAQWPRWQAALQSYARAHDRRLRARDVLRSAEAVEAGAAHTARQAEADLDATAEALAAAADRRRAARESLADSSADTGALTEAIGLVAEHRAHLEEMGRLAREVRRLHRARRTEAEAEQGARAEAEAAGARVDDATREEAEAQGALAEAETTAARARARRAVASQRSLLLAPDEPCPLCGSPHHPAGHEAPASEGAPDPAAPEVDAARARVSAAAEARLAATRARTDAAARAERAHAEAARAAQQLEQHDRSWSGYRESLATAWLSSPLLARHGVQKIALLVPEAPKRTGSTTELEEADRRLGEVREGLLGALRAQDDLQKELDAAQAQEEALQGRRGAAQAKVDAAGSARSRAAADATRARDEVEASEARTKELQESLEGALSRWPGWPDALRDDPSGFAAEVQQRVEAFEAKGAEAEALSERLEAATRAAEAATREDEAQSARLVEAKGHRAERATHHEGLAERRAARLDGQAVDAFVAAYEAALADAEARVARAEAKAKDAHAARSQATTRVEETRAALTEADATRARTAAALEAALGEAPGALGDRAALEAALAGGPEGVRALEARLAGLDAARLEARTRHADRTARLGAHRAAEGRPTLSVEEVAQDRAETEAAHKEVADELAEARGAARRDDAARAKLQDILPRIEAQRGRLELWSELTHLIGSADGKKLRTFAQGLTLEVLLEQANLHLEQLRPRYRLRRVPNQPMELCVVDADLGDEVRFLSSLSGGEKFLVSLALALGLSTLSSRQVKIESLFIDEGFGALDRETLEIALTTLDQLQAEGRTVGIISHVEDLAERVGYRVEVQPRGPGTSEVVVRGL